MRGEDINCIVDERCVRNVGYPVREGEEDSSSTTPFIRDEHALPTECEEYLLYIKRGVLHHGPEKSYEVASASTLLATIQSDSFNTVSALYTCPHCHLVFKNAKRFLIHYKWHSFGLTKDDMGGGVNKKMISLNDGAEKLGEEEGEDESPEGRYECETCGVICRTVKKFQNHKTRAHPSVSKDCKICNETFTTLSQFRIHLQSHNEGGTFPCTQCPKKFKFLHSLQRHIPTHNQEKNHPCEQCDKSFGSELLLKIHSKTHMKETLDKNLKCSYCPKTFHQSFRLTAHERTHTGVKPYQCDECDQSYPTNSSLNRHRRVSHSTDLPHVCSLCGKGFHIRSALEHHTKRSHLKEKPYQCLDCGNAYTCQSELSKHRNKAHAKASSSKPTGSNVKKMKKKKIVIKKEYSDDST